VTTHAPGVVNAVPVDGIRLLRSDGKPRVVRVSGLDDVRRHIDASPGDIRLGDGFVIGEGAVDAAVFTIWGRKMGVDPDVAGVRFVPAHGATRISTLAQLIRVAFEGARFHAVFDGDRQGADQAEEVRSRFGGQVTVTLLGRSQIENYCTLDAVESWLADQLDRSGDSPGADAVTDGMQHLGATDVSRRTLRAVAERVLGRGYRPIADGHAHGALCVGG
jgi:predicted ATP-dependent endonuclease of OLD family